MAASIVGVGLFDFLCVPPYFTFAVSDTEYLLTFAVMLIVALTITELTSGMRYQARIAAHRERRAASLAAMSRELSGALTAEQIAEIAVQHVRGVFEAPSRCCCRTARKQLHVAPDRASKCVAATSISRSRNGYTTVGSRPGSAPIRSRGTTDSLRAAARTGAQSRRAGAAPRNERLIFVPEQRACSIRSPRRSRSRSNASTSSKSPRKPNSAWHRNNCATRCWHPSRTICARRLRCITGAASSLAEQGDKLVGRSATRTDCDDLTSRRCSMSELTANVLDMARLETGVVQLNRQWHPFEEVVGAVLDRLRTRLEGRRIDIDLSKSPPLVWLDGVLIGQVLTNLLDNAVKYTPPRIADRSPRSRRRRRRRGVGVPITAPGLAAGRRAARIRQVLSRAARRARPAVPGSASRSAARSSRRTAAHIRGREPRGRRRSLYVRVAAADPAGRDPRRNLTTPPGRNE